jgi:transcriptional regulator with XRE-family HTH domain
MSASVLGKIEAGARRVDVDDLVALAAALDVAPQLLLPGGRDDVDPFADVSRPGPVQARILEDLDALGDLEALGHTAPTFAAIAVRLAQEIDAPASLGNSLQGLSKELRQVLADLRAFVPEGPEDDDDLDDLATPE